MRLVDWVVMRLRRVTLALFIAVVLAGAARAESRIILKVADPLPPEHVIAVHGARYFMDLVAQASHGRIGFEYFPAERLGHARDMLRLVQAGTADIAYLAPSALGGALPLSDVAELPGLFDRACAGARAVWPLIHDGPIGRAEYRPIGIVPVFVAMLGPRQLLGRDPRPATAVDLQGLRIRVARGDDSRAGDSIVRALGAAPVTVAPVALDASVRLGQVDAVLGRAADMVDTLPAGIRYQTVGVGFGGSVAVYAIGAAALRRLAPDLQAALAAAGAETTEHLCAAVDAEETAARSELEARGVAAAPLLPVAARTVAERTAAIRHDWAAALDRRHLPGSAALAGLEAALDRPPPGVDLP